MAKIKVGTFNCENMFTRYKFLDIPWDEKKYVDFIRPSASEGLVNFLPGREDIPTPREISRKQRQNTAAVVLNNSPDILAVQEVENLPTMRLFNSEFMHHYFKYSILIEGNDSMRMIDVGLFSNHPILNIRTHMFETKNLPSHKSPSHIFSRDCLEVDVLINKQIVTFLINHFKAQEAFTKRGKKPSDDVLKRRMQAERVVEIVEEKYTSDHNAQYIVLGDLNCAPPADGVSDLAAFYKTKAVIPIDDSLDGQQWTHFLSMKNQKRSSVSKMDYIFISPAIRKKNPKAELIIERGGLSPLCRFYTGKRFPGITENTEASDHCAVFVDLDI
ncbi:MAG: endonuclease/exonuclease/phosphatase family protein [Bacteroidota bacterium]